MIGGFALQNMGILAQQSASGPSIPIVVALAPTSVAYSEDGVSYVPGVTGAVGTITWTDGCFGSAGYLAVGRNGRAALSADGKTWENLNGLVATFDCRACAYSPTLDMYLVAGFDANSNGIVYQFNPTTKAFTQRNFASGAPIVYMRWLLDRFVWVASAGTVRMKFSLNGTSWTDVTATNVNNISYGAVGRIMTGVDPQSFIAVAGSTCRVSQTDDMLGTWIARTASGLSNFLSDILSIPGSTRVLVGANDTRYMRTDQAGASWTIGNFPSSQTGRMAYSAALNKIIVPGSGLTQFESINQGLNFTQRIRPTGVADGATVMIARA